MGPITRISSRLDRTARRRRGEGYGFFSMPRQCLKMIRSWTKSVKWAKSPGQTPEPVPKSVCPTSQTDRDHGVITNMAGSHAQHTQLKFSSDFELFRSFYMHFLGPDEQTDRRTDRHTHKAKPIHPRIYWGRRSKDHSSYLVFFLCVYTIFFIPGNEVPGFKIIIITLSQFASPHCSRSRHHTLCLMSHTLGMKYNNNIINIIRLINQDKPLDHNT